MAFWMQSEKVQIRPNCHHDTEKEKMEAKHGISQNQGSLLVFHHKN